MTQHKHSRQREREYALYRYRKALGRGDFDTIAVILKQAEHDMVLDQMIGEMIAHDESVPELKPADMVLKTVQPKSSVNGQPPNLDQSKEKKAMTTHIGNWQNREAISRRSNPLATVLMTMVAVMLLGGILLMIISSRQLLTTLSVLPTQQVRKTITPENLDRLTQLYAIPKQGAALSLVSFSPDSTYIAYENKELQIALWNLQTQTAERTFSAPWMTAQGRLIVFSADGKYLATNGEAQILLWNLETGTESNLVSPAPMWGLGTFSTRMAFSQDGTKLYRIACGHSSNEPACDRLDVYGWDTLSTEQTLYVQKVTSDGPNAALLPAAKLWAESNAAGQLVLHDLASSTTNSVLLYNGPSIVIVTGSPDGSLVSVVDSEPSLKVFDVRTGSVKMNNPLKDQAYAIRLMAFAPSNNLLATVGAPGDKAVQFWNVQDGQIISSLEATENNHVHSAAFSPDGTLLMTDSNDDMIRIWGVAQGS